MLVFMPAVAETVGPAPITVHLVPHTHDDVGWLKTVDQYYSGTNQSLVPGTVRDILNAIVLSLGKNPHRRFTYVEQAFFQRWWRELDATERDQTRALVKGGQLQFANGGWCMHDEAAAHYVDMIDQTTLGHRLIAEEFGPEAAPTVAWQLDPFGHSATHAALLSADAGMDSLFFGRIDYQELTLRQQQRAAEFVWRPSPSLGPDAQVFTGLTGQYQGNYGPPQKFNWALPTVEPVEDNPSLDSYNAQARLVDFVEAALAQGALSTPPFLLLPSHLVHCGTGPPPPSRRPAISSAAYLPCRGQPT